MYLYYHHIIPPEATLFLKELPPNRPNISEYWPPLDITRPPRNARSPQIRFETIISYTYFAYNLYLFDY
jgi:hypothetical protein